MMERAEYIRLRNWHQRAQCLELLPELDQAAALAWAEKERLEPLFRVRDVHQREHWRTAFYEAWGAALEIDARIGSIRRHLELLDEWEVRDEC